MVIWYICPVYGMFHQEKSGNPAPHRCCMHVCSLRLWFFEETFVAFCDGSVTRYATREEN
jgi:hypothetical protein